MRPDRHEAIAKWERRWLAVTGLMSVLFVLLIAYALATRGSHVAQRHSLLSPSELATSDLFAEPGVRQVGPNEFEVSLVAQAFTFSPAEIVLPEGAAVTFYMTSRDVVHAYQLNNSNVNVELIPGEVSTFDFTFRRPGVYRATCNEYCGLGHHNMLGELRVVPAAQFAAAQAGPAEAPGAAVGEAVYAANCASCHQAGGEGVAGVFPPLARHAAEIYRLGGREYLAQAVLFGLQGPIRAEGADYDGVMPAWQQLSDEQIAGVLDHIVLLGVEDVPSFEPYEPAEIAALRQAPLTPDEVRAVREALDVE